MVEKEQEASPPNPPASNPPAFPVPGLNFPNGECLWPDVGMALRDYFAAKAMQAVIGKLPAFDRDGEHGRQASIGELAQITRDVACSAYCYADAMLAERAKAAQP